MTGNEPYSTACGLFTGRQERDRLPEFIQLERLGEDGVGANLARGEQGGWNPQLHRLAAGEKSIYPGNS